MLNQPLVEKLLAMRLLGMVDALKAQEQDRTVNELSFLDRLSLLVDQQWSWRENQALTRRLKASCEDQPAWKTSIIGRHEAWIRRFCALWPKTLLGSAITRIFS